jgi:predicted transcriptional regulator
MKPKNSAEELQEAISHLEQKQAEERELLKEQFHHAYENAKPVNFIKNTIKDLTVSKDLKDQIVSTMIGLTAGYFAKKIYVRVSKNPVKRALGNALMLGITNAVIRNPEVVKAIGVGLFRLIRIENKKR